MLAKSPTEMIFQRHEVQVAHTQRKNMGVGFELAFSPFFQYEYKSFSFTC